MASAQMMQMITNDVHQGSGAPTYAIVQNCQNSSFSVTTLNCVFGSNLGTFHTIYLIAASGSGTAVLSFTTAGCAGVTLTTDAGKLETNVANQAWGASTSANACTIVLNSTVSTSLDVLGVEVSGSATNTIDAHSLDGDAFASSGTSLASGTPVTTTVPNDLVLGGFMDTGLNGGTFTAVGPSVIGVQRSAFGLGITLQTQSTAASVAPGATYSASSSFAQGILAVKP